MVCGRHEANPGSFFHKYFCPSVAVNRRGSMEMSVSYCGAQPPLVQVKGGTLPESVCGRHLQIGLSMVTVSDSGAFQDDRPHLKPLDRVIVLLHA